MIYRHTQLGKVIVGAMGGIAILAILTLVGFRGISPVVITIYLVVLVILTCFAFLATELQGPLLRSFFGFGLIHRSIALSDIREARSMTNPWYSGWGIRWRPGGYWLWNVSGYRAVELVFNNGKRIRIGTDEPEDLIQAGKKLI